MSHPSNMVIIDRRVAMKIHQFEMDLTHFSSFLRIGGKVHGRHKLTQKISEPVLKLTPMTYPEA